jgi:hypothetical protein
LENLFLRYSHRNKDTKKKRELTQNLLSYYDWYPARCIPNISAIAIEELGNDSEEFDQDNEEEFVRRVMFDAADSYVETDGFAYHSLSENAGSPESLESL